MTVAFDGVKKTCARLAVVATVALGASACSSIPDWVDPTTWVGDSGPTGSAGTPGESPDLADLPDRPAPSSTPDEQRQVAQSLAADRARAKYSSDALRGGTEPAAAPPPPPSTVSPDQLAAAQSTSSSSQAAPATPAPDQTSSAPATDDSAQAAPPPSDVQTASEPPPAEPAPQSSEPSTTASTEPAAPPPATALAVVSPSDAALGFKPSSAPPLDPSIAQFVPPPIIARYEQTASAAGVSAPVLRPPSVSSAAPARGASGTAVGGPDTMSGAVVANLDALQASAAAPASVYANPLGMPPAAVVLFPGDGTLLNAAARAQVRAAVEAFKQRGEQGFIRIVGHSSSRTSNMPLSKHLMVIFNKSQDRANAVAKEVIREGVPANKVLVEAVGDSQPVYYESMPKGEDGNRRAEIFLQS